MRFVKYQGLGNDFIVLLDATAPPAPEQARALCARGFGVGADGVMVAAPPRVAGAHVAMDLVNSDGSLPEMCGNGIRCLVKHAVDALGHRENPLVVETPAGLRACHWRLDAAGRVASVRVAMGPARFEPTAVPMLAPVAADEVAIDLGDAGVVGTGVNTGNPHFVVFGAFGADARAIALDLGPRLEVHPTFPEKANIELVERLAADHLRVTVWERGCGLTLACGTGATAAAAAAVRRGLAPADRPIRVTLPGGDLAITIGADFGECWMDGPVAEAFRGELGPGLADA